MNFQDLEFITDPYPLYAKWRQEQPIWWAQDVKGWVLSRYDDVRSVLKDPDNFSSELSASRSTGTMALPLLHDDPPRHTALRAIVNRSFTSRVMKAIESDLEAVVEQLLDDIVHSDNAPGDGAPDLLELRRQTRGGGRVHDFNELSGIEDSMRRSQSQASRPENHRERAQRRTGMRIR